MVDDDQFRRGADTPRRSRRAYYSRRRHHRLGATTSGSGFKTVSPQFMRRVKNRSSRRRRGYLHAMIRPIVVVGVLVADTTSQQLPAGYRYRTFAAGQSVLHARINASYLVAPDKLYAGIKDAAEDRKLALRHIYLEHFPENGEPEVFAVVK